QDEHVLPGDFDRASSDAAVPGQIPDDRERSGRLAAARLADEAVALLPPDLEADAANDLAVDPAHPVHDLDVVHRQCGGGGFENFGDAHVSSTCCTVFMRPAAAGQCSRLRQSATLTCPAPAAR